MLQVTNVAWYTRQKNFFLLTALSFYSRGAALVIPPIWKCEHLLLFPSGAPCCWRCESAAEFGPVGIALMGCLKQTMDWVIACCNNPHWSGTTPNTCCFYVLPQILRRKTHQAHQAIKGQQFWGIYLMLHSKKPNSNRSSWDSSPCSSANTGAEAGRRALWFGLPIPSQPGSTWLLERLQIP